MTVPTSADCSVCYGLQNFVSIHSEESDSVPGILCLQYETLLTSAFSKHDSVISLREVDLGV